MFSTNNKISWTVSIKQDIIMWGNVVSINQPVIKPEKMKTSYQVWMCNEYVFLFFSSDWHYLKTFTIDKTLSTICDSHSQHSASEELWHTA